MNLRLAVFGLFAKSLAFSSQLFGRGNGTALPGYFVETKFPVLLKSIGKGFEKIIWISGTNGKTTTRALLVDSFEKQGVKVCTNRGGANIIRGIASSLLLNLNLFGNPKAKVLILEVEEASLPKLAKYIQPDKLILTNIFRDQLDAYGEVDKTVSFFKELLQICSPKVFINADDAKLLESVADYQGEIVGYSLNLPDGLKPKFEQTNSKFQPQNIIKVEIKNSFCELKTNRGQKVKITTKLPGIYNLYNLVPAFLVGYETFGVGVINSLSNFKGVFGRGEIINIGRTELQLFLVKNPAGFNEILSYLSSQQADKGFNLAIAINDKIADGRDVSWLWDTNLEKYSDLAVENIWTSGDRGLDMLLRLEYAGFKVAKENNISNYQQLIHTLSSSDRKSYVLCTYTALLEFRKILQTQVKLKNINDSGN